MKLTIIRIEKDIVTCEIDDGTIIDLERNLFSKDIEINDVIEFDSTKSKA